LKGSNSWCVKFEWEFLWKQYFKSFDFDESIEHLQISYELLCNNFYWSFVVVIIPTMISFQEYFKIIKIKKEILFAMLQFQTPNSLYIVKIFKINFIWSSFPHFFDFGFFTTKANLHIFILAFYCIKWMTKDQKLQKLSSSFFKNIFIVQK